MSTHPPIDEYYLRAFRIFNGFYGPSCDELWWRTGGEYGPITLLVNCNDLFYWAVADCEPITPENIALLEQAAEDLRRVENQGDYHDAHLLFCCRIRGMRPQKPYYKYFPEETHALFDACGPERKE